MMTRIFLSILLTMTLCTLAIAKPVKTEVVKTADGWQLLRDGKPYIVKGAGGDASKELLAKLGGNSFRTWGADDKTLALLDEAQKHGLTVTVGIWLGHERHNFNYNDVKMVAEQYQRAKAVIEKYKDHPAVLAWGIGNEMEGPAGDNAAIWSAVQNIATMAHKLDPNHPTMTTIAEVGGSKVANIHALCPDIDIIGINTYAGAQSIPDRYRKVAPENPKPYIVTEFGPAGVWEVGKNDLGAIDEPNSTEKVRWYREAYEAFAKDTQNCLGTYAFTWGHKQEATSTWFGLFLPDGNKTPAVDALAELWSGKKPGNLSPEIKSLTLSKNDGLKPGETFTAKLDVSDPEGDKLEVKWVLLQDSRNYNTGGDHQEAPPSYDSAIVKSDGNGAEVKVPEDGGLYRLYAFIADGQGGGAMANAVLLVQSEKDAQAAAKVPAGKGVKLPFALMEEGVAAAYIPSGWMGETGAIAMNPGDTDNPHSGKTSLKVSFNANAGWGGVVWQSPANDWGDQAGGFDLTGATKLTFWARGDKGGEKVKFGFGVIGRDKTYFDTAKGETEVTLTPEWKQYTIDLSNKDLKRIKSGFFWSLAGQGAPLSFHLDDIRYE